jgi:hypothetical protein
VAGDELSLQQYFDLDVTSFQRAPVFLLQTTNRKNVCMRKIGRHSYLFVIGKLMLKYLLSQLEYDLPGRSYQSNLQLPEAHLLQTMRRGIYPCLLHIKTGDRLLILPSSLAEMVTDTSYLEVLHGPCKETFASKLLQIILILKLSP